MYGQDSGYKGYLDNMVWQIKELQKRFINKNYILNEIVSIYCTLYHFHVENMQRYPMNTEISLNWIRGYYELVMKPYEEYITETMLLQAFANVAAGQNIAAKGIIPTITFKEFDRLVRSEPMIVDPSHEICGATPAGHVPVITSPDWPVEITDYFDQVEGWVGVDNDTNKSRYGGMKRALGIPLDDTDYRHDYTGSPAETHNSKTNNQITYNTTNTGDAPPTVSPYIYTPPTVSPYIYTPPTVSPISTPIDLTKGPNDIPVNPYPNDVPVISQPYDLTHTTDTSVDKTAPSFDTQYSGSFCTDDCNNCTQSCDK